MNPKNPFLLLRLPANATTAEIKRAGQIALATARFGAADDPSSISRTREVETAIDSLRDPLVRFRSGLEWPSLGLHGTKLLQSDDRFAQLSTRPDLDRTAAVEELLVGESESDAAHIRSVFALLRAHALLSWRVNHYGKHADTQRTALTICSTLLSRGMTNWVKATQAREFWLAQRLRAREIDDPRVNSNVIAQFESSSTKFALEKFTGLASATLLNRDTEACKEIVKGMRECAGSRAQVDELLSSVYGPLCGKVTAAIEPLKTKAAALTSKMSKPYADLVAQYQLDIAPDIDVMVEVGDLPGSGEERARDAAAAFLRTISIAAANHADAYDIAEAAITLAIKVAHGASLRTQLTEDKVAVNRLSKNSAREKKTQPLIKQLKAAIQAQDHALILRLIDQLIPLETPENAVELKALRQKCTPTASSDINWGCVIPIVFVFLIVLIKSCK